MTPRKIHPRDYGDPLAYLLALATAANDEQLLAAAQVVEEQPATKAARAAQLERVK